MYILNAENPGDFAQLNQDSSFKVSDSFFFLDMINWYFENSNIFDVYITLSFDPDPKFLDAATGSGYLENRPDPRIRLTRH